MKRLWRIFTRIPLDERWLYLLIPLNILGAIYGFNWYRDQLASTPLKYWPVVPDSPLSTLLFGLVLLGIRLGRRNRLLEGVAYISMVKYGLWTMFVFAQCWWARRAAFPEEAFLFASHLGMAVEAVLYARYYFPGRRAIITASLWTFFNDYMDYVRGFHPYLPMMEFYPTVRLVSVLTSVAVIAGLLVWGREGGARRGRREGGWETSTT